MNLPAHKGNTKTFEQLSFQEQANSINAQINNLQRAIEYHVAHATDHGHNSDDVKAKCAKQIYRLLGRVI